MEHAGVATGAQLRRREWRGTDECRTVLEKVLETVIFHLRMLTGIDFRVVEQGFETAGAGDLPGGIYYPTGLTKAVNAGVVCPSDMQLKLIDPLSAAVAPVPVKGAQSVLLVE